MEDDFAELYGAPAPAEALPSVDAVQPDESAAPAAPAAAGEEAGDLFLQLYGSEAPLEVKEEAQGDRGALAEPPNAPATRPSPCPLAGSTPPHPPRASLHPCS